MDTHILQWNIRGLKSNFEELKLLLGQSYTPVAALQECKLGDGRPPPRGYTLIQGNTPGGEAALLIKSDIKFTTIEVETNLLASAAVVTLRKTFTICSLYLPPGARVTPRDLEDLANQLPKPFIILGDFNAHSPLWGDSRSDQRGSTVETFLYNNDLILLNSKEPTFIHSAYNTTSAIDLAVASASLALDFEWTVHNDLCGSDHFPIFLPFLRQENRHEQRFHFNKAD